MKVVLNKCYGGFSISIKAARFMAERGCEIAKAELERSEEIWYGLGYSDEYKDGYQRTSPHLVAAVEILEEEANGLCAHLVVVEIPDNMPFEVTDYDGLETLREIHRSW